MLAWAGVSAVPGLARAAEPCPISVGVDTDAMSLDPRTQVNTTDDRVNNLIYSGLIQLDETLSPTADLAVSWAARDPLTWEFRLRHDAVFHDGKTVSAEDVVFTYETLLDPAFGARLRILFAPVAGVEAIAPDIVLFHLKMAYAPLPLYLDLGIVPKHLAEAGHDLANHPVGSGPYRLVSRLRGSVLRLAPHPAHHGGASTCGLDLVVVPDDTARTQALRAGDLDLILSPLSPEDVLMLRGDGRFPEGETVSARYVYFNFNLRARFLSDGRVRRAISMLIDQQRIVAAIYGGTDQPASSVLMPVFAWCYTPDITQPAFDPVAAMAEFTAAGFVKDADGTLMKNGEPLEIRLSAYSEDSLRIQVMEILQDALLNAGLRASLVTSDFASFISNVQAGDYDIALLSWENVVDPDRGLYGQLVTGGTLNWGGYSNAEVDRALIAGRGTADPVLRAAAYQQAARIIAHDLPYYVLSYPRSLSYAAPRARGYRRNPRGFLRSLGAL